MNKIEIDKDWLYQKYVVEKLNAKQIGELLGIHYSTVTKRLKENGFEIRTSHPSSRRYSHNFEEKIINDYINGIGTISISKKYNLNRGVVQTILKRNNVKLRRVSPWKKSYNINFFDTYTKESCYWAGFIAADGNVRKDRNSINIHLQLSDLSHLEKFAKMIDFKGTIEKSDNSCRIAIDGEWYVKALEKNFDIKPQKTFNISFPINMPKEFLSDYLRGYFDGDGCISNGAKDCLHISFTSGSTTFLNQCIEYFYNLGIKIRKSKLNSTEKPIIQKNITIDYTCTNALKILNHLYKNSNENTRLTRKYNKYLYYKEKMEFAY